MTHFISFAALVVKTIAAVFTLFLMELLIKDLLVQAWSKYLNRRGQRVNLGGLSVGP